MTINKSPQMLKTLKDYAERKKAEIEQMLEVGSYNGTLSLDHFAFAELLGANMVPVQKNKKRIK